MNKPRKIFAAAAIAAVTLFATAGVALAGDYGDDDNGGGDDSDDGHHKKHDDSDDDDDSSSSHADDYSSEAPHD
jgi:hypothetical protein